MFRFESNISKFTFTTSKTQICILGLKTHFYKNRLSALITRV